MLNLTDFENYLRNRTTSKHTILARLSDVKTFLYYHELDTHNVQNYVSSMLRDGMDTKTVSRHVSSIKTYARFKGTTLGEISTPKQSRKIPNIISDSEMIKLRDEIMKITPRDGFDAMTTKVLFVLFFSAFRSGTALNVLVKNVDLEQQTIVVMDKGREEKVKPVYEFSDAIRQYIRMRPATPCPNLLIRKYGNKYDQLRHREMYQMIYEITERVLGRKINPHAFRHGVATSLLNHGTDLRTVQEVLGHKSIITTQIYTHIAKDKMRKDVGRLPVFN